ncbi:unnamed protein product [Vitrella brassicaformis CCMP3155]|uniref:Uncharacterized protein n=1 Tax=Vitrella brassicaformis (strain CCMP3155) TaxID=1169540 RepID=A0A0G4ECI2_VITBC|nr:unnamed protein product [Vitrella brassicaformis CCMP3155]|eukprot:CEL93678.1 unnamed protein product [Vitrella brassicaformis CCMP3155]
MTAAALGAIDNAHRTILLQMNAAENSKQPDWCKECAAAAGRNKNFVCLVREEVLRPWDIHGRSNYNEYQVVAIIQGGGCTSIEQMRGVCHQTEQEIGAQQTHCGLKTA